MFHLAVVFEEGNVVGRGFQTQHAIELVVHLNRHLAKAVLDTGAFDAGGKTAADFLRQLRRDLLAQESRHLLGLDREDRLPREFLVERLEDLFGTENQVGRVLDLHQAPVIGLAEDIKHRAALLSVTVENGVQGAWREIIRKLLGARPVVDTDEGVVGHSVADAGRRERTRPP